MSKFFTIDFNSQEVTENEDGTVTESYKIVSRHRSSKAASRIKRKFDNQAFSYTDIEVINEKGARIEFFAYDEEGYERGPFSHGAIVITDTHVNFTYEG